MVFIKGINFFANKSHGFAVFAKKGFIYPVFMILFAAGVMFSYLYASPSASIMTAEGYVYLFFASIGHAATFLLVPYLVYLLIGALGLRRTASWVMVALSSVFMILLVLNRQVYAIYRFHINGFIINMLTGEGAGDIFVLDTTMVLKESALLVVFIAVSVALYFLSKRVYVHLKKIGVWAISLIIMFCVLQGDTILEKGGAGELNVYDASMNPLENYRVNAGEMSAALEKLNRFFKR